jgi:lysyl-tRNA synthetase class 2
MLGTAAKLGLEVLSRESSYAPRLCAARRVQPSFLSSKSIKKASFSRNPCISQSLKRLYSTESSNTHVSDSQVPGLISDEVYADRKAASESYRLRTGKSYPPYELGLGDRHIDVEKFFEQYSYLTPGQELQDLSFDAELVIYGRVESKRQSGKKLAFYTIRQGRNRVVQVVVSVDHFRGIDIASSDKSIQHQSDFAFINETVKRGDVIAVRGVPYRTSSGELSLRVRGLEMVSPCLHSLPLVGSLVNKDVRYRFRHVDLLSNPDTIKVFLARSTILNSLRSFLNERRFVEVETPMLSQYSGGAAARPFSTHMLAQDAHLYLRIAPELYLKQLMVGGLERVYEIGKSFRNEGVDTTHNPEFTTCEFYQAYANYEDLMITTQEFLKFAAIEVNKVMRPDLIGTEEQYSVTLDIPVKGSLPALPGTKIDFSKPFRRINLVEEIERNLGFPLPDVNDASNAPKFKSILSDLGLTCSGPFTTVKMFDILVEHFVEPQCVQPTFLCNFPMATSPLAREHRSIPGATERFELFIARMELANAYTELNDPMEQRARFQNQMPDGESVKTNEDWYCGSLEWGLPPTGGWGLGLDRLTMVLTNRFSIKEVMLFPHMKPHDAKDTAPL